MGSMVLCGVLFFLALSTAWGFNPAELLSQHNTERLQFKNCPAYVWDYKLAVIADSTVNGSPNCAYFFRSRNVLALQPCRPCWMLNKLTPLPKELPTLQVLVNRLLALIMQVCTPFGVFNLEKLLEEPRPVPVYGWPKRLPLLAPKILLALVLVEATTQWSGASQPGWVVPSQPVAKTVF